MTATEQPIGPGHDDRPLPRFLEDADHDRRIELDELRRRRIGYYAAGRVLLATLFVVSGLFKLFKFDAAISELIGIGVQDASLVLPLALLLELIGGSMLAVGYHARAAAMALGFYLILLTLIFHWDLRSVTNQEHFITNVSLIGGCLMVVGYGAGSYSLDRYLLKRSRHRA